MKYLVFALTLLAFASPAEARTRHHQHHRGHKFHVEVRNIKPTSYDATVYDDLDELDVQPGRTGSHTTIQCCDGTYSPKCTYTHRGCCSWHGGVCE